MQRSIFVIALALSTAAIAGPRGPRPDSDSDFIPNYTPEYKVTDPVGPNGGFGDQGVSLTSGGLALVPANNETVGSALHEGVAYFYMQTTSGSWGLKQTLTDSAGQANEHFGFSLAMNGTTAVVGGIGANSNRGRACVYNFVNGAWTQVATLAPSDLASGDVFGYSVAITQSTILVGAPSFSSPLGGGTGGAVYAFQKNGSGVWTQVQKFTSSNDVSTDGFGAALAASGTNLIVTAPRLQASTTASVYLFDLVGGSWTQEQEIHPSGVGSFDGFTMSVDIAGDTAIVGAPGSTINTHVEGIVYVIEKIAGTWAQTQQLYLGPTHMNENFGQSVAVAGNGDVLIGAPATTVGSKAGQGIAYKYVADASGVYSGAGAYLASDGQAQDHYGYTVAFNSGPSLNGGPVDIAIGAIGVKDAGGNVVGAVYFYPYP